jgi:hypothetical protein
MSMVNVAFAGHMGAGKTTMATLVAKEFGYTKISFADGVREIKELLFPDVKGRKILQEIGMKMRDIDPNVWIKYAFSKMQPDKYYVIDDVRFKNEVDTLLINSWLIFKLEVSPATRIERLEKIGKSTGEIWHISELEPFLINPSIYGSRIIFIDNERPLDVVWDEIKNIIKQVNTTGVH